MQPQLTAIREELTVDYQDTVTNGRPDCMHFHTGYELVLGIRAENECFLHDTGYPFTDRTLIFIPARLVHIIKYKKSAPYTRYVVNFSHSFLQSTLDAMGVPGLLTELSAGSCLCVRLNHQQYFAMHDLFRSLHRAYRQERLPDARGCLSLLLLETARLLEEGSRQPPESGRTAQRQVRDIVRWLDENYGQDITLEELARRFFISKYHLCHIFHAVTGTGVVDYLQCRRVLEAQKLLMQGDATNLEIALRCGFHNTQHFYRVFRRVTGGPPGRYRLPGE